MSLNDKKRKIDWRNECIFCGKKKTWHSDIAIIQDCETFLKGGKIIVSVCPECRKEHSIRELYGKIIKFLLDDYFERW